MKYSSRPPTKKMIEKLRECHEKQLKNNSDSAPCLQEELKGALSGLYRRGFVETKIQDVQGKRLLCLFVTDSGVKFLKSIDNK